jgi:hypothetical protein
MTNLPVYVWVLVFIGTVGMPAVTAAVLYRGALAAGLPLRAARTVALAAVAVCGALIAAAAELAGHGEFGQDAGRTGTGPWFAITAGIALLAALLATRLPVMSRILAGPGTTAGLIWPHALRVAGVAFIIAMALGRVPAAFALPAGLGDIAIGLSAPLVARRLATGAPGARGRAVWFNVLGIADLVVAVALAFLAGIGPQLILHVTPSTHALALLPLTLIPTTVVPLALALHVISLLRLRADARGAAAIVRPIPASAVG